MTIVKWTGCLSSPSTLTRITANQLPGRVILVGTRTRQVALGGVGVEVAVGATVPVGEIVTEGVIVGVSPGEGGVPVRVGRGAGGVSVGVAPGRVGTGLGVRVAVEEGVGVAVVVSVTNGVGVAVVAINRQTGTLVGDPEMVARGFVVGGGEESSIFRDAAGVVAECIAASSVEERTDQGLMTEKLRVELRRFFKKRSGRRPLVLPVLMEI